MMMVCESLVLIRAEHYLPPSFIIDVEVGVIYTTYNVYENDGIVNVCAMIFEGCLQRDILIQYNTYDGTAEGIIHVQPCKSQYTYTTISMH